MGSEIKSLFKVWVTAYASLTFCYFIIGNLPKGLIRLISLLPIIILFTLLPLNLSSVHFTGIATFLLTWLCNFKLILFAFDQGPLSSNPSISLINFISIACLPIKIKHDPNPQKQYQKIPKKPSQETIKDGFKSPTNYSIKFLLLALVIHMYKYKQHMSQNHILVLYCFHVYFALEVVLAMTVAPARAILGLEIEPQFDEPYLSTSLQDFWGRRWNLMVTSILKPTVYNPIRSVFTGVLGRKYALVPAVLATFVVSGLMHELIYYYLSRVEPTWEVTWFFVLQGVCVVLEIAAKKVVKGRWQLYGAISGPLAIVFVAVTGFWLFFPQIVRNGVDVKAIGEYGLVIEFVKEEIVLPLLLLASHLAK